MPDPRPALRPRSHPLDPPEPTPAVAIHSTQPSVPTVVQKTALNARIDPGIHRAIRHAALDQGRTVAELVEDALREWLRQNGAVT
jgi:hypothetical protein